MKKIIYILVVLGLLFGGYMVFFKGNDVSIEQEGALEQNTEQTTEEQPVVTQDEVEEDLACDIDEQYGVCGEVIGTSVEGREIKAYSMGNGEQTVLVIGGVHTGIARNSHELASKLLEHYADSVVENVNLVFVPLVNPDGIANSTRTNANNVDLNRNWPTDDWKANPYHPQEGTQEGAGGTAALSEPEVSALSTYISELSPDMVIMYYSQAGSVEDNDVGIADTLGELYANAAGYEHIDEWTYYEVTGDLLTSLKEDGVPAMEVVLASREMELSQNIKGLDAVLGYFETAE